MSRTLFSTSCTVKGAGADEKDLRVLGGRLAVRNLEEILKRFLGKFIFNRRTR